MELPNEIISGIIAKNRQNFLTHVSSEGKPKSIKLPYDALQYLIPDRLYSLAHDPNKVRAADGGTWAPNNLSLYIAENIPSYDRRKPNTQFADDIYYTNLVDISEWLSKTSKKTEMIYLLASLTDFSGNPSILHLDSIIVIPEKRRLGLAKSFYERLREVAKTLGYIGLLGENDETFDLYTSKFNRIPISQMNPQLKKDLNIKKPYDNDTTTIELF